MKKITVTFLFIIVSKLILAQKPNVDDSLCQNFPQIGERKISNDGRYVLYTVNEVEKDYSKLYLKSIAGAYEKEYLINSRYFDIQFTEDSQWMLFTKPGDSLCLVNLINKREYHITDCQSFKVPTAGNGKWLAYHLRNRELILENLQTRKKIRYSNVENYNFSNSGQVIIVNSDSTINNVKTKILKWIQTSSGKTQIIWRGIGSSYIFDRTETKLAFASEDTMKANGNNIIWYYELGDSTAENLANSTIEAIGPDLKILNSGIKFSPKGDKLFFEISSSPPITSPNSSGMSKVDVWSHTDPYLQEQLLNENIRPHIRLAVINLDKKKVVILKKEDDAFISVYNEGANDNFLLVSAARKWEGYSSESSRMDFCLVNTNDGSRQCNNHNVYGNTINFSPGGTFLCWYDLEEKSYFTYDFRDGISRNITKDITTPLYDELWDKGISPYPYASKPVWLEKDEAVLIYDRYDVWMVDPRGVKPSVNITQGFGRRSKIKLRFVSELSNSPSESALKSDATLILSAFNEVTKDNGFFSLTLKQHDDPKELIMSPDVYYFPEASSTVSFSTFLKKAKMAVVYLLLKENASEFPNLVVTKDFKKFTQVSELAPHKNYNWLTTELVRWTTFDGRPGTGILYKPENFNAKSKYPIIFHFYEQLSDGLNKFIDPSLSSGPINIPYFVSKGYLVFCPDIHYTIGKPGESVYNYVVSASKAMTMRPFVDSNRMAIQGHSFGGFEVNYLVTRTKTFTAACSAAGPSDLISGCNYLIFNGTDAHAFYEQVQMRLGASLWQNKEAYIENSPILAADRIRTPLLIMHNKNDANVPWSHGVELFTALRRLGRSVWMLQYDNEGHTLSDNANQLDYTNKMLQFFDHYLKGRPVPTWMSKR